MGFDHQYMTGLNLGLGFSSSAATAAKKTSIATATATADFEPSLTLALSAADHRGSSPGRAAAASHIDVNASPYGRQASPHSAVSSLSGGGGGGGRVKRERDVMSGDEVEVDHDKVISSRGSDEDEDGSNARKKLRLTKDQSALLEESFKQHSTLNPKQKQALARQLNLRPRQVEVWFQNRRARTKLKQTEVDCEFLKKCCETLTDENRRLQKELQELKALKLAQPLYMHMPAATLTMCPSCERIGGAGGVGAAAGDIVGPASAAKSAFSLAAKTHFFNPFTNPSAAC